ncbi:BTB/POZ domain-containing protein [Quillaja saponaria]|uniref:BTB/POZ domain-containing protein n=1 Tax=Quillaja saponaria TaxID=32244 RepID=A0AAD7LG96_QUISA|nr:BTB/POZ domain-containing protein [Quillaja saponaria]
MNNSLRVTQPQGHEEVSSSDSEGIDQLPDKSIIPSKSTTVADCFKNKEYLRSINSQIPTDLSIQVHETTYTVHKYPLVSKSGYIARHEAQPSLSNFRQNLKLENFPGGTDTFEIILKFCYGLPIDLNSSNIAVLRCASEYLEMTEELEEGNLVFKTEGFLTFVVLSSWKDTIAVLKSCETLSPWAENLQIVRRCCDSIAWKAYKDNSSTGDATLNEEGWWYDDVARLRIDHFMRIITAIRAKGTKQEIIGRCIMHYAERWLPGMDVELKGLRGYGYVKNDLQFGVFGDKEEEPIEHSKEQKTIIESLISILPHQQKSLSCKFLLQMLKMAMVYSVSPALIAELEKRVGMMLEDAKVNDLFIPRYKNGDQGKLLNSPEECTMHDIDVVQRIVEYFLMHEQQQMQQQQQKSGKFNISKLLDNYLAEIATEPHLSITKFQVLAESLPENARLCHDGLYRAIDIYLKTHPSLPEHERRRLCKIMNCEKLSLDACMHAAQNDRLPLRTIVQVLFSEQVKMRSAMQEKEPLPSGNNSEQEGNQISTNMEIKNLKAELENVKTQMAELQSDYSELQQEYEKTTNRQKSISGWSSGWKKIKNSFQAKVDRDETRDEQKIPNPVGHRVKSRRRSSIS